MTCSTCHKKIRTEIPPGIKDDAGWAEVAREHAPDCTWVRFRAERLFAPTADDAALALAVLLEAVNGDDRVLELACLYAARVVDIEREHRAACRTDNVYEARIDALPEPLKALVRGEKP